MPEREVTIRIDLSGQEKITGLQQQIANLYGQAAKAIVINVNAKGIDQARSSMASVATTATSGFKGTAGAAKEIGAEVENVASNSLKNLNNAVGNVYSSFSKVAGMVAGLATGGAIAGFAYVGAEKTKLYTEEIYKAIDANTRLGVSHKMLQAKVASMVAEAPGWKTSNQATEELYNMMAIGGRYLGKGEKGLGNAESISKAWYANQEAMQKAGISSAEDLISLAARPGKLKIGQQQAFLAAGLTQQELYSPQARMKALEEMCGKVKIDVEVGKRPWEEAQTNIENLKQTVGGGIAPVMAYVTSLLSNLISTINAIPGGGALIGYVAIGIAMASALSLVVSMGTPLVTLFTTLKGLMMAQAVATQVMTASEGEAGVMALFESGANMGVAASAYAMAAGMWAAIAPILLIAVPLVALVAILYLIETKTHLFSNALKGLGKTQMAADLVNWFKDVGYWICQGISAIDSLYKMAGGGKGLKMGLDVATSGSMMLLKPTLMIVDFLYKLWFNSNTIIKLLQFAQALWVKMVDFFNYLWGGIQNLVKILTPPSVGKAAGQAVNAINNALGLTGSPQSSVPLNNNPPMPYNPDDTHVQGQRYYYPNLGPNGPLLTLGDNGEMVQITGGTSGVPANMAGPSPSTVAPSADQPWQNPNANTPTKTFANMLASSKGPLLPAAPTNNPEFGPNPGIQPNGGSWWPTWATSWIPKLAEGGLITRSGGLIGHAGEPIIPASISNSSHLQEVLTWIAGGSGNVSSPGNASVTLNGLHVDVHVDKLQTPQDLDRLVSLMSGPLGDKLVFALRGKLETNQLRSIGYLQG